MALEGFYIDDYNWSGVINTTVGRTDEFTFPLWGRTILATAPLSGILLLLWELQHGLLGYS
jgi:hypothetical protein